MFPDEQAVRLPYPGLRSFQRDESDLFFGREGSVNDMINRLRPNHFLAVLGTSGSGKSSLVRIGLLDGLELGLLAEAGSSWRIADFAPGANPLRNLARELSRLSGGGTDVDTDFLEAFLARGPRSVIEWCKDGHLKRGQNLLLLVDQFEELFRYQDYAERQAAEAFVALLIESAKSREVPIYVVITMRSEYLGACALIEGLAEIINDGQFLTPRLRREECREAIVGPAAVCGTVIEDELINRLLNDLEDFAPWDDRDSSDQLDRLVRRADQLPLLQHTLNRLWLRADATRTDKTAPIVLQLADYDAIGGLRGAINAHAEEILAKLGPGRLHRAEQVFRALTDGKSIATAVRRPTRFADLVAAADGDEAGTRAVVDGFRETGVNFLRPDTSVSLDNDTIVDISHESLIRQWRRLSGWLQEEARVAQEWTRLGEAASRFRKGEGSRYHGQDLHFWQEHERPTATWATRYNQPYEETLAFLDESIRSDKRQRRMLYAAIAAGLVVVVGFGGGGLFFSQLANKNAELEQLIEDLDAQTQLAQQQTLLAQEQTALAVAARDEATAATAELDRLIAEASGVFRASFDSGVGEYQHAGEWSASGALLGSLLRQTGAGTGADRTYDPEILSAIRYRLAEQSAFPTWDTASQGTPLPMHALGMQREGRYALNLSEFDTSEVRLVDRLTGRIVADVRLPADQTAEVAAVHLVTADGADAVIVTPSGEVFRWETGSGELTSYGMLADSGKSVVALALDPTGDRVAVLIGEEDSQIEVMSPDPELAARQFLSVMDWEMARPDSEDVPEFGSTLNGAAIGFWDDGLIVSFDDAEADGEPRYFAYVDAVLETGRILDTWLLEAVPTPDARSLIAVMTAGCGDDEPLRVIDATGNLDPVAIPSCIGSIAAPGDAFVPLTTVRPYEDTGVPHGTTIADVVPEEGEGRYRLILDDSGAGVPTRFAIDIAEVDGAIVAVPPDLDTPANIDDALALTSIGDDRAFTSVTMIEPWIPVVPQGDAVVTASLDGNPLVEIETVAPAGGDNPPTVAVRPSGGWPVEEDVGLLDQVSVAQNGTTLIAIAGSRGGVASGDALALSPIAFSPECDVADNETVDIVQLAPWSATTPVFFGLDAAGRIMRITPGGGGSGGIGGADAPAPGALSAACIDQVRLSPTSILLPDPTDDRVFLQTNSQEFRILSSTVRSASGFAGAPRIALLAPAAAAALVPGEEERLATVDRTGSLSVYAADSGWQATGGPRSVVLPAPAAVAAAEGKLLVISEAGEAVVVDLVAHGLEPVAAGRVPREASRYAILPDDRTVSALVAGAEWRISLPALGSSNALAAVAEASASAVTDPSDQALVALGVRLTRREGADAQGDDLALSDDARCFVSIDALLAAWQGETGAAAMESQRLAAARTETLARCVGDAPTAIMGRRLATTPHFLAPDDDPWPEQWSALLNNALSGNAMALRALIVGLDNSSDAFADAAGRSLGQSPAAAGIVFTEEAIADAAAGGSIDAAVQAAVEARSDSYEPLVHELIGNIVARSGGDEANLREAWVRYRVAEILYRAQGGRQADADRMAERRAGLARALPAQILLASWDEAGNWVGDADMEPATVAYAPPSPSPLDRMRADAERLAAADADDGRYRLLEAYLRLHIAQTEATADPEIAAASYARFAELLNTAASSAAMTEEMAGALAEASRQLVAEVNAGHLGAGAQAAALAPFMLRIAEPETPMSAEVAVLGPYTEALEAIRAAVSAGPVAPEILKQMRFANRRFDHGFRPEGDAVPAAETALATRIALLDALLAQSPKRWDWLAAKGTTEFWLGLAINEFNQSERIRWMTAAIRDLTHARALAGAAFPTENLYWLAEARRWMPEGGNPDYLTFVLGGVEDFAELRLRLDDGSWNAPLSLAELAASQAELLGLVADAEGSVVLARSRNRGPDDPAIQRIALDGLYHASEWDRVRQEAKAAGSEWSSLSPGFSRGPGIILGVLAGGLNQTAAEAPAADACDRLTSFGGDPARRAPGVPEAEMDIAAAIEACETLWEADTENPRLNYLLGRVLAAAPETRARGLGLLETAANAEYAAAFYELAVQVLASSLSNDLRRYELVHGFNQRAAVAAMPGVFDALRPRALTPRHLAGLRWVAERAGALGSAEAQLTAADLATDPEDRAYYLEVAARIFEEAGNEVRAEEIRDLIEGAYFVDASDRADEFWRPEKPVGIPEGLIDELRGAIN